VVQLKPPKKEGTDVPVPDGRHEKRSMIYEKNDGYCHLRWFTVRSKKTSQKKRVSSMTAEVSAQKVTSICTSTPSASKSEVRMFKELAVPDHGWKLAKSARMYGLLMQCCKEAWTLYWAPHRQILTKIRQNVNIFSKKMAHILHFKTKNWDWDI